MRYYGVMASLTAYCSMAYAQPVTFSIDWSWSEVVAGTTTPVTNANGILEPGESVLLRKTISFDPPVGTSFPIAAAPNAVVAGFHSTVTRLEGRLMSSFPALAPGQFTDLSRRSEWALGPIGSVMPGVSLVQNIGIGQYPEPGQIVNPENPIHDVWQAVWTPAEYRHDSIRFEAATPGFPFQGSLLLDIGLDPTTGFRLYHGHPADPIHGAVTIPMIPAPGAAALLLLLASTATVRRRRHDQRF